MDNREKVVKQLKWLVFNFPWQDNPENDGDRMCNAIHKYAQNAIDLMEADKPRLMTLDELDDMCRRRQAVYYEEKGAPEKCQDVFFITDNEWNDTAWLKGEDYTLVAAMSKYGKTWRCWTAKPTEEQRRAEPWK